MIDFTGKKYIFWDFDGVIIDSEKIRNKGFRKVLKDYPESQVTELLAYHKKNGGLSRYVKFRYFFEVILNKSITEDAVNELSQKFSAIMREELANKNLLISQTIEFIENRQNSFGMFIVSGSDEKELNELCEKLGIRSYFGLIKGSPTPKIELVRNIIVQKKLDPKDCLLIGDSINDFDAAIANEIDFYGFNNRELKNLGTAYIEAFEEVN